MAKKEKDLSLLISQANIYAGIEEKRQKLVESFQKQGIPLENKPFDKVEKALLLICND